MQNFKKKIQQGATFWKKKKHIFQRKLRITKTPGTNIVLIMITITNGRSSRSTSRSSKVSRRLGDGCFGSRGRPSAPSCKARPKNIMIVSIIVIIIIAPSHWQTVVAAGAGCSHLRVTRVMSKVFLVISER